MLRERGKAILRNPAEELVRLTVPFFSLFMGTAWVEVVRQIGTNAPYKPETGWLTVSLIRPGFVIAYGLVAGGLIYFLTNFMRFAIETGNQEPRLAAEAAESSEKATRRLLLFYVLALIPANVVFAGLLPVSFYGFVVLLVWTLIVEQNAKHTAREALERYAD